MLEENVATPSTSVASDRKRNGSSQTHDAIRVLTATKADTGRIRRTRRA